MAWESVVALPVSHRIIVAQDRLRRPSLRLQRERTAQKAESNDRDAVELGGEHTRASGLIDEGGLRDAGRFALLISL